VRITWACNNRCIFCLDSDVTRAQHIPAEEVRDEIRRGYAPGARLILSGGEASIHPEFIEFIRYGREIGYEWIQTISNGRSFASEKFAKAAADAGLNEVTFSIHGHNDELHDTLSGVKGGFRQALKGLLNLRNDGRVVISVDIVLNRMNVPHLDDILRFFMRLGVHEFDLLQLVPFGRAWSDEWRESLFYNIKEALPHIKKALDNAHVPGNFIWTNRFPVQLLEGLEDLIQDPHKLHDELRGRRKEFEQYINSGEKLLCYGERCRFCFARGVCHEIYSAKERVDGREVEELLLTVDSNGNAPESLKFMLETQPLKRLLVSAPDIAAFSQAMPQQAKADIEVRLGLDDWRGYAEFKASDAAWAQNIKVLHLASAEAVEKFVTRPERPVIEIRRDTAAAAWKLREEISKRGDAILHVPSFEAMNDARAHLVDMRRYLKGWLGAAVRVENAPLCMHPQAMPPEAATVISADCFNAAGRLDVSAFAEHYIKHGYFSRSERCTECIHNADCRGMHINYLRLFGFATLIPQKK